MERRILCGELWPHMGADAERYDRHDNAGAGWHFSGRGELSWDEGPQPSSRAANVLDLVGVDWRRPKRDMGLNHEDTGHRPELPPAWSAIHPDARLFEIKEEVFPRREAISALEPEIDRLSDIWTKENKRMHDEFEATRTAATFEEREAMLAAMPEFKEYMRLRELQELHRGPADDLVKQMWEIKAQTPEGRRSKVIVLLGYVMEDNEWRRAYDPGTTFDIYPRATFLSSLSAASRAKCFAISSGHRRVMKSGNARELPAKRRKSSSCLTTISTSRGAISNGVSQKNMTPSGRMSSQSTR